MTLLLCFFNPCSAYFLGFVLVFLFFIFIFIFVYFCFFFLKGASRVVHILINKNCFIKFVTLLQPYACMIHASLTTLAWSLLNVFKRVLRIGLHLLGRRSLPCLAIDSVTRRKLMQGILLKWPFSLDVTN